MRHVRSTTPLTVPEDPFLSSRCPAPQPPNGLGMNRSPAPSVSAQRFLSRVVGRGRAMIFNAPSTGRIEDSSVGHPAYPRGGDPHGRDECRLLGVAPP